MLPDKLSKFLTTVEEIIFNLQLNLVSETQLSQLDEGQGLVDRPKVISLKGKLTKSLT